MIRKSMTECGRASSGTYVANRREEIVLEDFALAPTTAHAMWPSGSRTPARARRFVDLLVQRLKKEVI